MLEQQIDPKSIIHIYEAAEIAGLRPASGSNGRTRRYYHPFDESKRPCIVAYDDTNMIHDFSGTAWDHETLDPVGLIMEMHRIGFWDAVEMIGVDRPRVEPKILEPIDDIHKSKLDFGLLYRTSRQVKYALPYLRSRYVSPLYSRFIRAGYWKNCTVGARDHRIMRITEHGEVIYDKAHAVNRITLPNFYTKPRKNMLAIYMRLDQADAKRRFKKLSPKYIGSVVRGLYQKGKPPTEDELIKTIYGAKYITMGNGKAPFQRWQFVVWGYGRWISIQQPVGMIFESQFDAINAYELLGVPAMAARPYSDLGKDTAGTEMLYIVRDNDDAGLGHANRLKDMLGERSRIVSPYPEFKDFGEMVQAGIHKQWFKETIDGN